MSSLIAAKADYIIKADRVYRNLQEAQDAFEAEALVLDVFKCMLARGEEIDDFTASGIRVYVFYSTEGYELYYLDFHMSVSVFENRIADYSVQRY